MKKMKMFLGMVTMASTIIFNSCSSDNGSTEEIKVENSKIKKLTATYDWGTESFDFTYDLQGRVKSAVNDYGEGTEDITYDYSVTNRLTITKGENVSKYALDANGRIIKAFWGSDETGYEAFEYDANGYMTKLYEHYDGADHLKFVMTITNGNVTKRIRYEEDGTTIRDERNYTYLPAENYNSIPQVYTIDSDWKNIGGLYGKMNKNLLASFTRGTAPNIVTTSYTYTFDSKNRVASQTKVIPDAESESWSYIYLEDVK